MANLKRDIMLDNGTKDVHARADASTNAINTIDYPHHEIHGGSAYTVIYSALGDDTAAISLRIQTPNTTKWPHMEIAIEAALAATIQVWYPTTKTHDAGNAITPLNRNHNSTNTSGCTICHTPSGAQAGTATITQYIGAATVSGRADTGGGGGGRHEWVLAQNNDYYILVTSRADSNAMSIILDWYEHTSKG